jgi:DNA gyrase subunit A
MVTKNGVIKKCELTEFNHPLQRGIIALGVEDGDELISAKLTAGNNLVFIGSHEGQANKFLETEVRAMGRPAYGVRAMDLEDGDYIVGAEVIEPQGLILTISENGFGKRTPIKDYRLTHRGGKGVVNMKTTNRTGRVVAVLSVNDDSDVMIVSKDGKMIRIDSNNIRQTGRSAQGVCLVKMEEGDRVAGACVIPEATDEDKNGGDQGNLPLQ